MKSTTSKMTALLTLVATFLLMTQTSEAGWLRRGSSGSFGSSGSSGSYGSSGSSGSWGSSGSFGRRWWGRHHSSGSWGSSGYHSSGSSGSYGSSGSSGYLVPAHGQAISSTSTDSTPAASNVAQQKTPEVGFARLKIDVPEEAVVHLAGQRMSLTGAERSYLLPHIPQGKEYDYPIKVELNRAGQTLSLEHNESVSAGTITSLEILEQSGQLIVRKGTTEQLIADSE